MFILEFVVYDLLGEASLLVGLMALIGLLIQFMKSFFLIRMKL